MTTGTAVTVGRTPVVWAALAAVVMAMAGCQSAAPKLAASADGQRRLEAADFTSLEGWNDDQQAQAVGAFLRSCERLQRLPAEQKLGDGTVGTVADWQPACAAAAEIPSDDDAAARRFFEDHFDLYAVSGPDGAEGLFTGYYEPSLKGSWTRDDRYFVPLYAVPNLVGDMPDRAAIYRGALANLGLELIWVDDAIDAFFLEVQGSGQVELEDGSRVQVGYAGQNGHPYFAIGRALVERGDLTRETVSLQTIKAWLRAHPDEALAVMEMNPSYIFFRLIDGPGPIGAQSVALTAGRSLAVDRAYTPLSLPIWLDSSYPDSQGQAQPLRRLLIAQDTGGAIKGVVRGDVFWGAGAEAEQVAGEMKNPGRYYWLVPKRQPQ